MGHVVCLEYLRRPRSGLRFLFSLYACVLHVSLYNAYTSRQKQYWFQSFYSDMLSEHEQHGSLG